MPTTSISFLSIAARKARRPMRPNPLIPTFVIFCRFKDYLWAQKYISLIPKPTKKFPWVNYFISRVCKSKRADYLCASFKRRSVRLGVRTPDFHSGNTGSIPVRTTGTGHLKVYQVSFFYLAEACFCASSSLPSAIIERREL